MQVEWRWSNGEAGQREFEDPVTAENWARDMPLDRSKRNENGNRLNAQVWLDGLLINTYDGAPT